MSTAAVTIGTSRIELTQGDITQQELEAIANAANSRLAGGGGVVPPPAGVRCDSGAAIPFPDNSHVAPAFNPHPFTVTRLGRGNETMKIGYHMFDFHGKISA